MNRHKFVKNIMYIKTNVSMSFIMPRAGNGIRQQSFMVVCSVLLMLLARSPNPGDKIRFSEYCEHAA